MMYGRCLLLVTNQKGTKLLVPVASSGKSTVLYRKVGEKTKRIIAHY